MRPERPGRAYDGNHETHRSRDDWRCGSGAGRRGKRPGCPPSFPTRRCPCTPRNRPQGAGVRGRMSGAKAAAAAFEAEGVPCVFGVPGAQNNEFWDAMKTLNVPYMLNSHESAAPVMADASARISGRVGAFALIPGPGLTNAMTGIGEALLDTVPIVGIGDRREAGAGRADGAGSLPEQRGDPSNGDQGGDRGPSPRPDRRRDPPRLPGRPNWPAGTCWCRRTV